jgi:hypothetical protein
MKFKQDPESGCILIELQHHEKMGDIQDSELLADLLDFVNKQSKQLQKLTNCYNELVERLNNIEKGKQV